MMEWVQTLPIVGGVAFLYLVILLRAGGTYALGRGARKAANRGKVAAWLESERVERASRIINKWGAPVVAFSFLTVGFQTAANAAAGLTGMSLKRYLPALAVGGFAWAVIYATVGLAAVALWLELFLHSPWAAVAALALVVVLIIYLVGHRRRTGHTIAPIGTGDEGENGEDASRSEMPASRP
ncbi:MAG TPA: VTT domain-containing protein [Candidatus Brachybacterium merdavium]|uniref:VTT domain-containing protein n=1 Tax=Candidatus Brachybacterium merdavium TaxID=2838513 RepID=A0A9D2LEP3_9MICO|nr:VTT domain-containing protein [Candidatus Brachybacterium merdavium]